MKKLIMVVLVVCIFAFAACSQQTPAPQEAESSNQLENPVIEVQSIEEIKNKLGDDIAISLPDGASGMKYSIIDNKIGQIGFSWQGDSYNLRVQKTDALEDISGVYAEFETTKELSMDDYPYTIRYNEGKEGVSQWYDQGNKTTYSVSMDTGATEAKLVAISVLLIPAG
ncbi:MAG: hypothetical protein VB081_07505 [Christensenella sp.]|uniref:hypothetical protein n=1 Tax=Christensenella sp. TaxID=1935934 RepID=UPI002B1F5CA3|nr:hypothetical protein [Christensenella sp.]MEA5003331.1 hypothetical protein [Christensenella sp.]